jgi:MFS family permease
LLPGFLLAGTGLGLSFVPVTIGAVSGVRPSEAGVASGLITTTQQVGGALGVAVLSTIAISATNTYLRTNGHAALALPNALTHGFSIAFLTGAILAALGAAVALVGFRGTSRPSVLTAEPELVAAPTE